VSDDRLLAVVCVRDGIVVRSNAYRRWRPAGRLRTVLRNLDRWAADEIVVVDISRRPGIDSTVTSEVAAARITTPLCVGGGIREADDALGLLDAGCDRFLVEELFLRDDPDELGRLVDLVGRQAVIGSLPVRRDGSVWTPGDAARPSTVEQVVGRLREELVSEVLVTSVDTEGAVGTFPVELLDAAHGLPAGGTIWFGGLDARSAARCLDHPATSAVAFGNLLLDTELALPRLRTEILALAPEASLRSPEPG
jgi:cyclase